MSQIIAAIRLIFSLLPLITETVHGLQAAFPNAGVMKLNALLAVVEEAAKAEAALEAMYNEALPKLAPMLTAFVTLIKNPTPPAQ